MTVVRKRATRDRSVIATGRSFLHKGARAAASAKRLTLQGGARRRLQGFGLTGTVSTTPGEGESGALG